MIRHPMPSLPENWPAALVARVEDLVQQLDQTVQSAQLAASEYGQKIRMTRTWGDDVAEGIEQMLAELEHRPASTQRARQRDNEWLYELVREVGYHASYDGKAYRRLAAVPVKVLEAAGVRLGPVLTQLAKPPVEVLPLQLTRREWEVLKGELNVARDNLSPNRSVRRRLLESVIKKLEAVVQVDG